MSLFDFTSIIEEDRHLRDVYNEKCRVFTKNMNLILNESQRGSAELLYDYAFERNINSNFCVEDLLKVFGWDASNLSKPALSTGSDAFKIMCSLFGIDSANLLMNVCSSGGDYLFHPSDFRTQRYIYYIVSRNVAIFVDFLKSNIEYKFTIHEWLETINEKRFIEAKHFIPVALAYYIDCDNHGNIKDFVSILKNTIENPDIWHKVIPGIMKWELSS